MSLHVDVQLERGGRRMEYAFEHDGGVLGVVGPSGAGKTTLLHLVAGLLQPTRGTIRLGDCVLFDAANRVPAHRRRIGVVFQDDRLFPHLSVGRNLHFAEKSRPAGAQPALPRNELIAQLELDDLLERAIATLSGGERRRVALGRTLLAAPDLLLLDEPLVSLDDAARRRTRAVLQRALAAVDRPVLFVSHDLTELLQVTGDLLLVDDGKTRGHGTPNALAREDVPWHVLRRVGLRNVLPARVRSHDAAAGLTQLALGDRDDQDAPTLRAPLVDLPAGQVVRIAIRPEDIALAQTQIDGISIRNQLPTEVVTVTAHADRAVIEIDVGARLLVEVSHQTVAQLRLVPGARLWCLIKSNAIECVV